MTDCILGDAVLLGDVALLGDGAVVGSGGEAVGDSGTLHCVAVAGTCVLLVNSF